MGLIICLRRHFPDFHHGRHETVRPQKTRQESNKEGKRRKFATDTRQAGDLRAKGGGGYQLMINVIVTT